MEARADRFRRLIEPQHDRVLAFARSLCRTLGDGDDLFQEAMLRAYNKLDALREDPAFRAWLYRIVISIHRSRARRAFWRRFIPLGDDSDDGENETDYRTEAWAPGAAEANHRARTALSKLPAAHREAIVLFEIEGWQVDEIAALHEVSASAIKSRLARGREKLRALYDAQPTLAGDLSPTEAP